MLKMNTYARCVDSTGVLLVKVIQVMGSVYKRRAVLANKVFATVKAININATNMKEEKMRKKFKRGTVHRAVVVYTKQQTRRKDGTFIWSDTNAVILVDRSFIPYSRRINVPLPREVANRFPALGASVRRVY